MYINGDGVKKDYEQAKKYLMSAALAEYPPALYDLGAMYRNGEGVEKNLQIAKNLYIKSAELKYPMAIKELIRIYKLEGNEEQMNYWIEKSKHI